MYLIRLIVVQYRTRYPGEYMPNVADAWDEYTIEGNPDGYAEALEKYRALVPSEYEWVREIDVMVPENEITGLADVPVVSGTVS